MKNSSYSVPLGMVMRKFYCHQCGERLIRHSKTRTIKPDDPDYKSYSRIGHARHMIGDIELTEYDFKCLSCEKIIGYDEQSAIGKIQKRLRKHILSQEDIAQNMDKAKAALKREGTMWRIVIMAISLAVAALAIYLSLSSGDRSIRFYL